MKLFKICLLLVTVTVVGCSHSQDKKGENLSGKAKTTGSRVGDALNRDAKTFKKKMNQLFKKDPEAHERKKQEAKKKKEAEEKKKEVK